MPISTFLAPSAIAKPGVCTSSTRPASPYEGQVIYETDTDKAQVWNGSAWVLLSTGTANPPGLEFITSQTIGTAVASVSVSDAFNSNFDSYRVVMRNTNAAGGAVEVRLTLGAITTSYFSTLRRDFYDGTLTAFTRVSNGAYFVVAYGGAASNTGFSVDILNPYNTARTQCCGQYAQGLSAGWAAGECSDTSSVTSLTVTPSSSTFTGGTITVYGYRRA